MTRKRYVVASLGALALAGIVAACGSGNDEGGSAPSSPAPAADAAVSVKIIGLNDFHGNLEAPGGSVVVQDAANPAGTRVSAGGAAYLAALIQTLKAKNPNNVVVAAGDMVGASPLVSGAFHEEPAIDVLGQMGLEISSVGNHEFDKGRDELLRLQNGGCFPRSADGRRGIVGVDTCMTNGAYAGAKFQYLAANVIDQATGKPLLPAYRIKTFDWAKVAFIGMTLKDTPSVVTPAGTAGLTFESEADTVNKLIPELRQQNVNAIVVLLHEGGSTTAGTVNDKSCPGLNGAIVSIVDKLDPAVDIVVSGHTHQEYVCTRPDGKLLTQTGSYGRLATEIDITIDPATRRVSSKLANNRVAVNDLVIKDGQGKPIPLPAGYTALPKDSAVDAMVSRYVELTAPIKNAVVGAITASIDRTQTAAGESALGDLVADAYLAGTSDASFGPAVIAFTNPGGLRQNLTYDAATNGQTTFGQLYAVMPFGNSMVTMSLTGAQILRLLEQQWESPQPAGGRVLQVSSGFTYTWDASKPASAAAGQGNRVDPASLRLNGVAIDPAKIYRVTVNNFMASGGDNFTVLKQGTNQQAGPVDIDVFEAYFRAKSPVSPGAPNRITRLN